MKNNDTAIFGKAEAAFRRNFRPKVQNAQAMYDGLLPQKEKQYRKIIPEMERIVDFFEKNAGSLERYDGDLFRLVIYYNFLGDCYLLSGDYKKAYEVYLKASQCKAFNADEGRIIDLLRQLAQSFSAKRRLATLDDLPFLRKEHLKIFNGILSVEPLKQKADYFFKEEKFLNARKNYERAIEKANQYDYRDFDLYINLGDTYLKLKHVDKAWATYKEGLRFLDHEQDRKDISRVVKKLANVASAREDYTNAVVFYLFALKFDKTDAGLFSGIRKVLEKMNASVTIEEISKLAGKDLADIEAAVTRMLAQK